MLILVEGARESGKTYLTDQAVDTIPDLLHYKFDFPYWLNQLNINKNSQGDHTKAHYISIANPITLLEFNYKLLNNQHIIMDRSIFSAYVWSLLLNRANNLVLFDEIKDIINSEYYQNIKLIYVYKDSRVENEERKEKTDVFEYYKDVEREDQLFRDIIKDNMQKLNDSNYYNDCHFLINDFTQTSVDSFNRLIENMVNK